MYSLDAVGTNVFILILFAGIYLSLFGLPGTVIVFFDVLIYALLTGFASIGLKIILSLLIICLVAETVEFLLDISEAVRIWPSKAGFLSALAGGFAGAVILTPVFLGPGIIAGFFLGGFAGVLAVELYRQSKLKIPFKASYRSFFIMIGGKTLKGALTLSMIAVALSNIYS